MSKYTDFWTWFKSIEQELETSLDQCKNSEPEINPEIFNNRTKLFDELYEKLQLVSEGLGFEFGPKIENKTSFYITANGISEYFDDVISLSEQAPDLNHFTVIAFRQRTENPQEFRIKYNNVELGYDALFFKYYIEDNKINLLIAAPGFSNEEKFNDNDQDIIFSIFVLLDQLLGEYDATYRLGEIDFNRLNEQNPEENGLPLLELRDLVDNLKQSENTSNNLDNNHKEENKPFTLPSDEAIAQLSVEEKLDLARDICNENNYVKALEILESIKDKCVNNPIFYYRYAVNLMHNNRFNEALLAAKKSHELDKTYRWAYLVLSQLLYWQNNFVEAYELAKAGLRLVAGNESDEEEFLMVLRCMYKRVDFCDPHDFQNSVLLADFENYDNQADAQYRIGTTEDQWAKFDEYYDNINLTRKTLDFYVRINAPLREVPRDRLEENISFSLSLENLGVWVNTGTFVDEDKDPKAVDYNFDVYADVEDYENKFIQCLYQNVIPKGTEITISTIPLNEGQEPQVLKSFTVGEYDLVGLVIDNTKVSEEDMKNYTYEQAFDQLLQNVGIMFYTFVDKTDKTYIYYATKDFHSFAEHLKAAVADSVFSRDSVIFNATANI